TYWPAKLSWLRKTQPDVFREVRRWVSFGELVQERLTGSGGVSVSMASGTGLMNVHSCDWDDEVLAAIEIDRGQLNPLIGSTPAATSTRWPSLRNVPWAPALGDGPCSNVGANCTTPDRFGLMVGTSGAERAAWSPTG